MARIEQGGNHVYAANTAFTAFTGTNLHNVNIDFFTISIRGAALASTQTLTVTIGGTQICVLSPIQSVFTFQNSLKPFVLGNNGTIVMTPAGTFAAFTIDYSFAGDSI